MNKKIYSVLQRGLWAIAALCTAAVAFLNLGHVSEISYDARELVTITEGYGSGVVLVFLLGCLVIVVSRLEGRLEKINEEKLFRLFSFVYTVFAVYLILNVDDKLRADPKTVFNAAQELKEGIYTSLQQGQYLYRYPHQLGFVFYLQILMGFSENIRFVFLVNFLMVLGINHIWWRISRDLFQDKAVSILTLCFSFLFLPQLFFILFSYGLIPGFFFLSLGFYHTMRFLADKKPVHLVGMALFTGLTVLLKQNYFIGAIAELIVLMLGLVREKNLRILAGMLAVVVFITLPGSLLRRGYEQSADVQLDNASPSVLWVAMGTDMDNNRRGPGWYNSYSWQTYNEAKYDARKASELGRQKLQGNLEMMKAEPEWARKFFLDKTVSQWCDPMFGSVWSGPLAVCGQQTHTELLQSIYNGEEWENRIASLSRLLCLGIWIFALVFLVLHGRKETGWELLFLYFIGGFLFHMFWEAKSQYVYTYVFGLIPCAAFALKTLAKELTK